MEDRLKLPNVYFNWRDGLLASPRFQRWAAAFPITRPIARRRSRALFDICAGFVYSQILKACIELHLFEILAEGPIQEDDLAKRLALTVDATSRLMKAAISLDLARQRGDGRYGLGTLGAALIGNPSVARMVEHHALLYADLADPVSLLKGSRKHSALAGYWPYATACQPTAASAEQVAGFSQLMSASQALITDDILEAYPFDTHRCLLDIGGGEGTFLRAVAQRAPRLELVLFDLPAVAHRAQTTFSEAGIAHRARAIGGDFIADPIPSCADAACLIRVLHDHDDARARTLLHNVRCALPKGGTLLICEPMSQTPGAEPIGDAYFGFYLLAMGSGRTRTPQEIQDMLHDAGFTDVREIPTRRPFLTSLIRARH